MKFYLLGIGGTGMSALAGLLKSLGHEVSGSDQTVYYPVNEILNQLGIDYHQGYALKNIQKNPADVYVIGNIIGRGNPEAEYILDCKLNYLSLPEALYQFVLKSRITIAVAGTYGKTTTASLLAFLLHSVGIDCGYFVGGKSIDSGKNYHLGTSPYFVIEADEYETAFFDKSAKFFKYRPDNLILNPLEHDHLDIYPKPELYFQAFKNLIRQIPSRGVIVYPDENEQCRNVLQGAFSKTFAYSSVNGELTVNKIVFRQGGYDFYINYHDHFRAARINLFGEHNVWNAAAAISMLLAQGLENLIEKFIAALPGFRGVARRIDFITNIKESYIYEDFAHHPASIEAVLKSLHTAFPEHKLVVLFEPRSWTLRLNDFFERILKALLIADQQLIMEVYQKEKIVDRAPLDVCRLVKELNLKGRQASLFSSYQNLQDYLLSLDYARKSVYVMISNGSFGNLSGFFKELKGEQPA